MDSAFFVQNIKDRCRAKGVPPTVACKEAGVGGSFLNDIVRGQTPSVAKVQMMAAYLGCTVSELLGEQDSSAAAQVDRIFEKAEEKYGSLEKFAKIIEVPLPFVQEWRKGTSTTFRQRLRIEKIASKLGVSVAYLLTGEEKKPATVTDGQFSDAEMELIKLYRQLTPAQQDMVNQVARTAAAAQKAK